MEHVALSGADGPRTREGSHLDLAVDARLTGPTDAQSARKLRESLRARVQARLDGGASPEEARAHLADDVKSSAAEAGLEVVGVDRADLDVPGATTAAPDRSPTTDLKVILVGFDGFDWDIAQPLMDAGRMPHLSDLVRRGTRARLQSISPMLSPVVWTTIATGKLPQDHGILDFLGTGADGSSVPVTSNLRKVKAFWNMLSDAGQDVGVSAWWATWPAEPVRGFVVTDRVAYELFHVKSEDLPAAGKVYPQALWDDVLPLVERPQDVPSAEVASFLDRSVAAPPSPMEADLLEQFQGVLASTRTYSRAALLLHDKLKPRVGAYYFEGSDTACHLFMRYAPPRLPEVDARAAARFGPVVDRMYEYCDRILGQFMERADARTVVMVVSDHGFRSGAARPATESRVDTATAAEWHERYGVFAAAGPGLKAGHAVAEASVTDVLPTLLTILGMPVAKDFAGHALEDAFTPEFLAAHPVRTIPTYEDPAGSGATARSRLAVASPEDRAILEKLVAIGYVSAAAAGSAAPAGGPSSRPPAAAAGPAAANAHNNLGMILLRQGETAAAMAEFRKAIELSPAFSSARVNLARALVKAGRIPDAENELRAIRAGDPHDTWALALLASLELQQGHGDEALILARQAVAAGSRSAEAWGTLGDVLAQAGHAPEARSAWSRASELDPDNPDPLNSLGNSYEAVGEWGEAARWFAKAIDVDPTFAPGYNNLGLQYQRLGRWDEALALYEKGRTRLPHSSILLNNLATWHHERALAAEHAGRPAEEVRAEAGKAAGIYQEAMKADPLDASPVNNYGAVSGLLGKPDEEIQWYEKATQLDPRYTDALYNVGLWNDRHGRAQQAHDALARCLAADPGYTRAVQVDAHVLLELGRGPEALGLARSASERKPRDPWLHLAVAGVLDELGRRGEACEAYRASLALDANQPDVAARVRQICGS